MNTEVITDSDFAEFSGMGNPMGRLNTGMLALLDADFIKHHVAYRIYKEIEKQKKEGRLEIFFHNDPAIEHTKDILYDLLSKIEDPIIFCFSGKSTETFRSALAFDKVYKGNRKEDRTFYDTKIDDMFKSMRYIMETQPSLIFDDLEADDVLCALQSDKTYIISKDKDLKQIPGSHYDWGTNRVYEINQHQAVYNLAMQLLKGDTVDNISGLPGVGEVNAAKILAEVKPSMYIQRVLHEYQMRFGVIKGADMFSETWLLVKLRENRGDNFIRKYKRMFDLRDNFILKLKG